MTTILVSELKDKFLQYHSGRGYQVKNSFPIVLKEDPTLLFVNATVAPLKSLYLREGVSSPEKYALIQNCLRLGGASNLDQVGINPYYHTFFEMMGTCVFNMDIDQVIFDFFGFIEAVDLNDKNLFFTVPKQQEGFKRALERYDLPKDHILTIEKNDLFWQYWQFGIPGPAGHGMTVIFTPIKHNNVDMSYVMNNINNFLEFANIIYINEFVGKEGNKIPLMCPGFDMGIGVERLAAILQNCNNYEIDTIKPLTRTVIHFLEKSGIKKDSISQETARVIADHLRAICILVSEGIEPSKKMQGYVLRKLIRRTLTRLRLATTKDVPISALISEFYSTLENSGPSGALRNRKKLMQIIEKESVSFNKVIHKGLEIIQNKPETNPTYLEDTLGFPRELAKIVRERKEG